MKEFICNLTTDHWLVITPIILSVVSIVIAIASSRSTSKMARKQINALKDVGLLQIGASLCDLRIEGVKAAITERKLHNELRRIEKEIVSLRSHINKDKDKNKERLMELQEERTIIMDDIKCIKGLQGHIVQMQAKWKYDWDLVNKDR